MPPLTNIFGSDDDEPFEPGSYLPLQPLDEDGEPADGEVTDGDAGGAAEPPPLLGPDAPDADLPPADG